MSSIKRLSPPQSRKVNSLVRRECCNCDNGHCILLDDGDECVCPQLISYSLLCKWFRIAVLPLDKLLYECTCSCCQQQSSIYGESAENRKRAKTVTKNRFRKINLISNLRLIINNSNSDLMLCKTTKLPNVGR